MTAVDSGVAVADLTLIPIQSDGSVRDGAPISAVAVDVLASMAALYEARGFVVPWIGYLARHDGDWIGTCAFTSAPVDGRVEIAYYCFAGNEGCGVATAMARQLLRLAQRQDPGIKLYAMTLPEENASTGILRKLGFVFGGELIHPEDGKVWRWDRP